MKLLTEEQLLGVVKGKKVYIYGAGAVADLLIKRLKRYGVAIYIIMDSIGEYSERLKTKVSRFTDISTQINKTDVVIVAATEKDHDDIEKILKEHEIINYHTISDRLYVVMERLVNKRFKLQTHIVEHCNLKCKGCYHFSSLAKEEYLDLKEYERDIKQLSILFEGNIEEILLLGGEPLLHPEVEQFFYITRKFLKKGKIRILTNGLLLFKMSDAFWESIKITNSELWVTKYPVNFDYDKAVEYANTRGVKLSFFTEEPVRTLGHQPLDLAGKRDYINNFLGCYRANNCIDLKHGKVFSCIIPAEIKPFSEYFNTDFEIGPDDYVDIYAVNSAEELLEKMERPMPFCRYCNRDQIDRFGAIPWSQTEYKIEEWTV
ncbi:radical SAM protein [Schwartzia succinivorans]|jgi:hypothetical protein|uniref:Shikimate / quinate 5-dehydrogenase n=1 Tax=Schwartzia succinivorans DSM 10502 TaxID=1123243 RepID=A0A1M4SMY7_9FIRM|nr:radical SAM protein [Schwartzia succinivorans]SHE33337.1 Shikimate / quinate 5-dehydrogenase [Schwartzia succinivorans DSM 10502]